MAKYDWSQYESDFNRFEEQCQRCSCYYENWEHDPEPKREDGDADFECSLEFDTGHDEPCGDFDDCK